MQLKWNILVLLYYVLSVSINRVSCHFDPPKEKQTVFLVSFDGFRWDYLHKTSTPNFDFIVKTGVKAKYVMNTFITKTFPNHYSIVTGLYEESHGIVANTMYDPVFDSWFYVNNTEARWWKAQPIWVTNEKAEKGRKSAVVFWPGSAVKGQIPSQWLKYDSKVSLKQRIDSLLESLKGDDPPNFLALYYEEPDKSGHQYGPDSLEVQRAIRKVDNGTGYLLDQLNKSGLLDKVNLIITSDHGMANVSNDQIIYLSDCNVTMNMYTLVASGPPYIGTIAAIIPSKGNLEVIYNRLNNCSHYITVYKKEDIPEHFHYIHNRRITPILAVADEGWQISPNRHQHLANRKGNHGYSNRMSSMHPFFIARGPIFKEGYLSEPFRNVDIYPLICDILGIEPASNNGSLARVQHLLKSEKTKKNYSLLIVLAILILVVFGLISYGIVSFCTNHHCKMRRYGQIYDLGIDDFEL